MVSTSVDHVWFSKSDGLDMMILQISGKHISQFDECKPSMIMQKIIMVSRSYALQQDTLIFTEDIPNAFQFLICDMIHFTSKYTGEEC